MYRLVSFCTFSNWATVPCITENFNSNFRSVNFGVQTSDTIPQESSGFQLSHNEEGAFHNKRPLEWMANFSETSGEF